MESSVGIKNEVAKLIFGRPSASELEKARAEMLNFVWDWVLARYSNIRLETVERNLAQFVKLKKQDDACKMCVAVTMCPSKDQSRMNGKLCADGVVDIWMEPCPQGFRPQKSGSDDSKPKKVWNKSE